MKIIKQIFDKLFCMHSWEFIRRVSTYEKELPVEHKELYVCRRCGKFKKISL